MPVIPILKPPLHVLNVGRQVMLRDCGLVALPVPDPPPTATQAVGAHREPFLLAPCRLAVQPAVLHFHGVQSVWHDVSCVQSEVG